MIDQENALFYEVAMKHFGSISGLSTTEFAFICLRILEANFFVILFTSYRKKYANFIHYVIEALPKISQGVTVTNALCPPGLTN